MHEREHEHQAQHQVSMLQDRYLGCLAGLAVGDALGTTVEFSAPGTFQPVEDLVGGGVFQLEAGQWTDDTSMALCLAESLIEQQQFDAADQMRRYVKWFRDGYLSCKGYCFDIGNATREALLAFERTGEPFSGPEDPYTAGNGSIMRLAAVPMRYAAQPEQAVRYAELSSRTTHGAAEAVAACGILAAMVVSALHGAPKAEVLAAEAYRSRRDAAAMSPRLAAVLDGSYQHKQPPEIKGSGYVVESLEAALWAFAHSSTYKEGALLAVNLGNDADTTAAVYGQLAGAYYGYAAIPEAWRQQLAMRGRIEHYADQLLAQAYSESARRI